MHIRQLLPSRSLLLILLWMAVGCSPSVSVKVPDGSTRQAVSDPWFVDVSERVGLDFTRSMEPDLRYAMPRIMGSGGGLVDFDLDGNLDVYLINGGTFDSTASSPAALDRLFRQSSDGNFDDVTVASGLEPTGYGMGLACGDIDNDGFPDLLLTNYGRNQLLRNNGDGTFSDVSDSAGLSGARWSTAACFADVDRDGFLDLFVVDYVDYIPDQHCEDRSGRRDFCGPNSFQGTIDRLFRNTGEMSEAGGPQFTDITIASGLASNPGKGLGVACSDFNGDGRIDFYVANDMESNHLWIQQPDGTFLDMAISSGTAVNQLGEAEASMGIARIDLNGDGDTDLFLTHIEGETNTYYESQGEGLFADSTPGSGLGPPSLQYTAFGVVAADLNHNRLVDLVMVNGRVQMSTIDSRSDASDFWRDYAEINQIFLNEGAGKFRNASAFGGRLTGLREVSRGLAAGDVDNDGDVDLLLTNCAGRSRLFLNELPKQGKSVVIRLVGTKMNRDGIGARVRISVAGTTQEREVSPALGYLTHSDFRVHFGLGTSASYQKIEVIWTDGVRELFPGGPAGARLTLRRGDGRIEPATVRE